MNVEQVLAQPNQTHGQIQGFLELLRSRDAESGDAWYDALSLEDHESLYALAYQLYNATRFQEARRVFQLLVRVSSADVRYASGLAACLHMLGEFRKALEFYAVASVLDPTDCEVLVQMAVCFLAVGRTAEARDVLDYGCAQAQAKVRSGSDARAPAHLERMQAMLALLDGASTRSARS